MNVLWFVLVQEAFSIKVRQNPLTEILKNLVGLIKENAGIKEKHSKLIIRLFEVLDLKADLFSCLCRSAVVRTVLLVAR